MACKYIYKGTTYTKEQFESFVKEEFVKKSPKNQFLSLLEKDSNWVTFFIKSIIADSAKKGYEKVIFPKGDTASKIEGHSTLEEFKRQKEDRIKELEGGKDLFEDQMTKEELDGTNNEINQLKQELERVETEGFGALKPIYKFYEETIGNILKKQGYNPQVITDEYGNQWYEVTVDNKFKSDILFSEGTPDKNYNPIYEKGYTNIKQYIQDIADSKEPLSPLAKKLLGYSSNNPVIITSEIKSSDGIDALGQYNSITREIKLNPYNDNSSLTILHEYIHALTHDYIRTNPNSEAVKELTRLYDLTKSNSELLTDKYPIKNLDEFITGIFTRPRFINDLMKIKSEGKSIITHLLQWFAKLFKFNPEQSTLFEQVFTAGENLLNEIQLDENLFSLEKEYNKILQKHGIPYRYSKEINPNTDWPTLLKDISKVNRQSQDKIVLYQSPSGKWLLRIDYEINSSIPVEVTQSNIAQQNSNEFQLQFNEMSDVVNKWDDYFTGYDFLTTKEKTQLMSLVEQGLLEMQCKL